MKAVYKMDIFIKRGGNIIGVFIEDQEVVKTLF